MLLGLLFLLYILLHVTINLTLYLVLINIINISFTLKNFNVMKNGQKILISTALIAVSNPVVDSRGDDRIVFTVAPYKHCGKLDANGNATVWLSTAHAARLAQSVGAETVDALRSALAQSFEDTSLAFELQFCKAGEPILDDNGVEIEDGGVYGEEDWFKLVKLSITLEAAESVVDYLADINKELDLEDAREARKARRAGSRKKSVRPRKEIEIAEDDNEDVTSLFGDDEDDDAKDEAPLTKAQMKAANSSATKAGKAKPFTAAQIRAAKA
jgi:hypothetical protein